MIAAYLWPTVKLVVLPTAFLIMVMMPAACNLALMPVTFEWVFLSILSTIFTTRCTCCKLLGSLPTSCFLLVASRIEQKFAKLGVLDGFFETTKKNRLRQMYGLLELVQVLQERLVRLVARSELFSTCVGF